MLFKILRGNQANLPSTLTDGYCYFLKDKHYFYVDYLNDSNVLVRSKLSAEYADRLRYIDGDEVIEIAPEEIALKSEVAASWTETVVLTTINWVDNTQTVAVNHVTESTDVFVSAEPEDLEVYSEFGIYCSSQSEGSLTFTKKEDTNPTTDISVHVLIGGIITHDGLTPEEWIFELEDGSTVTKKVALYA